MGVIAVQQVLIPQVVVEEDVILQILRERL
jgi:hypothetical protein